MSGNYIGESRQLIATGNLCRDIILSLLLVLSLAFSLSRFFSSLFLTLHIYFQPSTLDSFQSTFRPISGPYRLLISLPASKQASPLRSIEISKSNRIELERRHHHAHVTTPLSTPHSTRPDQRLVQLTRRIKDFQLSNTDNTMQDEPAWSIQTTRVFPTSEKTDTVS